jgi:hypothetical protein
MTKREAKREALNIWRWISDHPGDDKFDYMRASGKTEIMKWANECPLCEWTKTAHRGNIVTCRVCPLALCMQPGQPYRAWVGAHGKDLDTQRSAAALLVKQLEAWNVK